MELTLSGMVINRTFDCKRKSGWYLQKSAFHCPIKHRNSLCFCDFLQLLAEMEKLSAQKEKPMTENKSRPSSPFVFLLLQFASLIHAQEVTVEKKQILPFDPPISEGPVLELWMQLVWGRSELFICLLMIWKWIRIYWMWVCSYICEKCVSCNRCFAFSGVLLVSRCGRVTSQVPFQWTDTDTHYHICMILKCLRNAAFSNFCSFVIR